MQGNSTNIDGTARVLAAEFRETFAQMMQHADLGEHEAFLMDRLSSGMEAAPLLFAYGLEHLPSDAERPDNAMASYFSVLAEITGLNRSLVTLAIDAMLYCESDQYVLVPNRAVIVAEYEKATPLLY